jgi:PKD repeat protein
MADFTSDITGGDAPVKVSFIEEASNSPIPLSFTWTFNGGNPVSSNDGNPEVEYAVPGDYDVTLKVENEDGSDVITKKAYINVTSLEDLGNHLSDLIIYPNPASDIIYLKGYSKKIDDINLRIISQMGQIVYESTQTINANYSIKIDLSQLNSGLYYLEISNTHGNAAKNIMIK